MIKNTKQSKSEATAIPPTPIVLFFSNIIQFKLMKYINLLFFLFFSVCSFSQIQRVDPPNWWVGFKNNELQLMIKGEGISKYKPSVEYSGIEIKNFHRV